MKNKNKNRGDLTAVGEIRPVENESHQQKTKKGEKIGAGWWNSLEQRDKTYHCCGPEDYPRLGS